MYRDSNNIPGFVHTKLSYRSWLRYSEKIPPVTSWQQLQHQVGWIESVEPSRFNAEFRGQFWAIDELVPPPSQPGDPLEIRIWGFYQVLVNEAAVTEGANNRRNYENFITTLSFNPEMSTRFLQCLENTQCINIIYTERSDYEAILYSMMRLLRINGKPETLLSRLRFCVPEEAVYFELNTTDDFAVRFRGLCEQLIARLQNRPYHFIITANPNSQGLLHSRANNILASLVHGENVVPHRVEAVTGACTRIDLIEINRIDLPQWLYKKEIRKALQEEKEGLRKIIFYYLTSDLEVTTQLLVHGLLPPAFQDDIHLEKIILVKSNASNEAHETKPIIDCLRTILVGSDIIDGKIKTVCVQANKKSFLKGHESNFDIPRLVTELDCVFNFPDSKVRRQAINCKYLTDSQMKKGCITLGQLQGYDETMLRLSSRAQSTPRGGQTQMRPIMASEITRIDFIELSESNFSDSGYVDQLHVILTAEQVGTSKVVFFVVGNPTVEELTLVINRCMSSSDKLKDFGSRVERYEKMMFNQFDLAALGRHNVLLTKVINITTHFPNAEISEIHFLIGKYGSLPSNPRLQLDHFIIALQNELPLNRIRLAQTSVVRIYQVNVTPCEIELRPTQSAPVPPPRGTVNASFGGLQVNTLNAEMGFLAVENAPVPPPRGTVSTSFGSPQMSAGENECCICMTDKKEYAFIPCGHKCVCKACGDKLLSGQKMCPICRTMVTGIMKIFG